MRRINVQAEVLETEVPTQVCTSFGNKASVTDVWIEDETGKIKLCLWGDLAKSVTVGDIIQIKNASVRSFKGERQLRLERNGTVSVLRSQTTATEKISRTVKNIICT